jgi:hypothetical protein
MGDQDCDALLAILGREALSRENFARTSLLRHLCSHVDEVIGFVEK